MTLVDKHWNSGLYDFDEETEELTKVLKCYNEDGTTYFYRAYYHYNKSGYKVANKKEIAHFKDDYFDDEGNLIYG